MFTAVVNATTGKMEWEKVGDDEDSDISGDLARYLHIISENHNRNCFVQVYLEKSTPASVYYVLIVSGFSCILYGL